MGKSHPGGVLLFYRFSLERKAVEKFKADMTGLPHGRPKCLSVKSRSAFVPKANAPRCAVLAGCAAPDAQKHLVRPWAGAAPHVGRCPRAHPEAAVPAF